MKLFIKSSAITGMANLNPLWSGLPVIIWADHGGVVRKVSHNTPRVNIGNDDYWAVVSIANSPRILAHSRNIKKSESDNIKEGMAYVQRNYYVFLKHFNDTNFSFDDEDLFNELRARGEYR